MLFPHDIESLRLDHLLIQQLQKIQAFQERFLEIEQALSPRLHPLQELAWINSVGASLRIEGLRISNYRIREILTNHGIDTKLSSIDLAAHNYGAILQWIYTSWKDIPLTQDSMCAFHARLFQGTQSGKRAGKYKRTDNALVAYSSEGLPIGIVLETISAQNTPACMEELIVWTEKQLQAKTIPDLCTIGLFIVTFLAIHPFADGNGRVSRLLTTLLLLRAGYRYVTYRSLENILEVAKKYYYMALHATQKTMQENRPQYRIWLTYWIDTLACQCKKLQLKLQKAHRHTFLPEIEYEILLLIESLGPLQTKELVTFTHKSRSSIHYHLQRLMQKRLLEKRGIGRDTRYGVPTKMFFNKS